MNEVPRSTGNHHITFPVTKLERSRRLHEQALGPQVLVDFPDEYGTLRGPAGLLAGTEPPVAVMDGALGWALDFSDADPDGTVCGLCGTQWHGIDQTGRPGYARPVPAEEPSR